MPNKPITLIVPFAAGGNLDIVARLIAPGLAKQLGQSVVVQNKPGAGGVLGATELSRAEADGTVLLVSTPNAITVAPKMVQTQYTLDSFAAVGLISSTSLAFWRSFVKRMRSAASVDGGRLPIRRLDRLAIPSPSCGVRAWLIDFVCGV
jgi:tripartite-type tricarboxylate transporter receptor subunit TctC